jgi:hypothetical protein
MKDTVDVQKQMMKETNIDNLQDVMDDMRDMKEDMEELNDIMARQYDIDVADEELDAGEIKNNIFKLFI